MIWKKIHLLFGLLFIIGAVNAQILTKEDSLSAGLTPSGKNTVLSGYGEIKVQYDNSLKVGNANLTRFITFFGHRFSKNIALFSELEIENAKIANGTSGEISLEQTFLKFDLNRSNYIVAGLFIPRIGIINENHLPTTFNGNDRPFVETYLIPSTWREIGVGWYGKLDRLPGFNYYLGVTNGLSSQNFSRNTGIRNGRFEGNNATASNIAITAAGLYYIGNFRLQASCYYGGSAGLSPREADSLQLNSGPFGTPVALVESNMQYSGKRWNAKALASIINIADAENINAAYANNTPEQMIGTMAEISYNLLNTPTVFDKKLLVFGRYEWFDLNYIMSTNGIKDNMVNQQFVVGGITYKPAVGVAIKFDLVHRITGTPNQAFNTNPFPQVPIYFRNNTFVNLGFGYNF